MSKLAKIVAFIEVLVICLIAFDLVKKLKSTSTTSQINTAALRKEDLIFPKNEQFKYYFTLTPENTIERVRPWDQTVSQETINKDGLNDRFDYQEEKPANTVRIITLGDSFTYGLFVDTKDNWPEVLEDILPQANLCQESKRYEVINLAMPGFDIPYLAKRYKDIGKKYHADLIIWFESGTGYTRNYEKMRPLIDSCDENLKNGVIPSKEFVGCWREARDNLINQMTLVGLQNELKGAMESFLTEMGDTPVIFATFTDDHDIEYSFFNTFARQPNIYLTNAVKDINHGGGVFPDYHPNQQGHKNIASDIFNYLYNNQRKLFCEK